MDQLWLTAVLQSPNDWRNQSVSGSSMVSLYWKTGNVQNNQNIKHFLRLPHIQTIEISQNIWNNLKFSRFSEVSSDSVFQPCEYCRSLRVSNLVVILNCQPITMMTLNTISTCFLEWSTYMAICSSFVLFLCVDRYTVQGIYPEIQRYLEVVHPVDDIEESETEREQVPDTKSILFLRKNLLIFKVVLLS